MHISSQLSVCYSWYEHPPAHTAMKRTVSKFKSKSKFVCLLVGQARNTDATTASKTAAYLHSFELRPLNTFLLLDLTSTNDAN